MNKVEMSEDILVKELEDVKIFSCIDDSDKHVIRDFVEILSYDAGEVIIEEGSINNGLYVLLGGKIEIIKNGKWEDIKLATLHKNSIFGETSLFKDKQATATVKASESSTILLISKEQFLSYINNHPKAGNVILTYIIFSLLQKLNSTNEELVQERNVEFSSEDLDSMMSMFHPMMNDILGKNIDEEDKKWLND